VTPLQSVGDETEESGNTSTGADDGLACSTSEGGKRGGASGRARANGASASRSGTSGSGAVGWVRWVGRGAAGHWDGNDWAGDDRDGDDWAGDDWNLRCRDGKVGSQNRNGAGDDRSLRRRYWDRAANLLAGDGNGGDGSLSGTGKTC